MQIVSYVRAWFEEKLHLDQNGQATTEYVVLILGVVTFLIVSAFALRGALNSPVTSLVNWISGVTPAPP